MATIDQQEALVEDFVIGDGNVRDTLAAFDREVIRKALPETTEHRQLLRPAMLEALLEYTPTSRAEFFEMIPSYLRQAIEGQYLDQVFEIINASLEQTGHPTNVLRNYSHE